MTPLPAAVLFCADVARLAAFYEAVAGLARVSGDATHAVLEGAGFQLVVHAIRGESARAKDANEPPSVREDSYLKVCFPVASLAAARALVASLGGALGSVDREWSARGFRACDGHDPEGNVFQLREAE